MAASWLGLDVWLFESAGKRRWGTTSEQTLVRQTHLATLPDGADHDPGALAALAGHLEDAVAWSWP